MACCRFAWSGGFLAGTYRCYRHSVGGGKDDVCAGAPLVLGEDGTYQVSAETGTYSAREGKVRLSGSGRLGIGRLMGERLVFEYAEKGLLHRVTYLRQASGDARSAARVVVAIEGDARINTASLLPQGAMLGLERYDSLAWADGPRRVEASFRNVPVGRIYTLYAGTEREMRPVGSVDLRGSKGFARFTVKTTP